MKITKVDIYLLDAGDQRHARKPIVCRVHTDQGIYGDGEAGVAYGAGANAAFGMIRDLADLIIGDDPMDIDPVWEKLFKTTFWGQGGGAIVFSGISALNIALMDIKGKALNIPCYQLLGGKFRNELRCYASQLQFGWTSKSGPYGKTKDYVMITEHALSEGYDAVKIDFTSVGRDGTPLPHEQFHGILSHDTINLVEERMRAIRDALGYNFDLIVENHCRTDASSAIAIGQLCDEFKVFAYEEVTTMLNPSMHRVVREKVNTPIAAGERIYSRWGYINFFRDNSVQLIQPDVCNCGGLSEAKKICDLAQVFDVTVQAHVAGAPISTAGALQLEAAIPNFCIHEHHFRSTQEAISVLCKYDWQPVNGKYQIPDLPGLGQEISDFAIKTALAHHVCN
ncbi:MAG: mandelate racemase/muconate lactonizing enzyme family protein [Proteobacteria bacterium]|nr:mandelate racemase/muconate lactonizing enzyme family protein [Pseudomonadota bacterium]